MTLLLKIVYLMYMYFSWLINEVTELAMQSLWYEYIIHYMRQRLGTWKRGGGKEGVCVCVE